MTTRPVPALCIALVLLPALVSAAAAQWTIDDVLPSQGGRIGLRIEPMTPELREFMKAPRDRGVLVVQVEENRPAERAGLKVGDVVTAAGGTPVDRPFDLVQAVAGPAEGESLELEVYREGQKTTLTVLPEGAPQPWMDPDEWKPWLERHMRRGSEELRRQLEEIERRLDKLERERQQEREQKEEREQPEQPPEPDGASQS